MIQQLYSLVFTQMNWKFMSTQKPYKYVTVAFIHNY